MSLREKLEGSLNDFSAASRRRALDELMTLADCGEIPLPPSRDAVNLHCHTFFSYNGYGYSPSCFAWKARCAGLRAAGIVDFDVLDAVDEFLGACRRLDLRGCAGIETRVFVPPFETREINSPGEPGVAYFMGVGFPGGPIPDKDLLAELKSIAQTRNREIAARVNLFLTPAFVNYERDVLPLTPKGNATERHLCAAYNHKARTIFPDAESRAAFWSEKLQTDIAKIRTLLDDSPGLEGLIRAKTMKAGGVGYVKPSGPDFPPLDRVSGFVRECGAIPTFAWLDGTTTGEQAIEELLDTFVAAGAAVVNIIPDRNWNIKDPETKRFKMAKLREFIELATARDLPLVVGTEMNAYGQPFVDDFDAPELDPFVPVFLRGAHIMYAHTVLEVHAKMGYLSDWARTCFGSIKDKNDFFEAFGETLEPGNRDVVAKITPEFSAAKILKLLAPDPSDPSDQSDP